MKYKRLMITGGYGFIGSNFINYLFKKYKNEISVLNIDSLTYASNQKYINSEYYNSSRYKHFTRNINDITWYDINKFKPDCIIHFAAESHVDRAIISPEEFIKTNINGTFNLLELARRNSIRFHQISTDEVYGSLSKDELPFNEYNQIKPSSPYSASKASADMLVMAYYKTYNLPVSISRCSNNYGKFQHEEKFIPTVIKSIIKNEPIPVYGTGANKRDWIHVEDHCRAIDLILNSDKSIGQIYNVGAENCISNIEVINKIIDIMEHKCYNDVKIKFVTDRLGHDFRYAIDNYKIKSELGFYPKIKFETGLKFTVDYYLKEFKCV